MIWGALCEGCAEYERRKRAGAAPAQQPPARLQRPTVAPARVGPARPALVEDWHQKTER